MDKCLEVVDAASPNSSVIWQTHNSPSCRASNMRMRFSSPQRLSQGHKLTKLHTSYFDTQRNIIPSVLPMSSGWRKWLQKWLSDGALYVNGNIGNARFLFGRPTV